MTINLGATLGEIVSADERHAPVLDDLGIDYCCGGHRTLGEAATEAGLDGAQILGSLLRASQAVAPEPEWSGLDAAALCDHITATHHALLRRRMPSLLVLSDKVLGVHGDGHPELSEVHHSLEVLWAEMEPHLDREESELFPAIAEGGDLRDDLVDELGADHELVGALLETLRSLTDTFGPPDDACDSYRSLYRGLAEIDADTRMHVHKENNVLFPLIAT